MVRDSKEYCCAREHRYFAFSLQAVPPPFCGSPVAPLRVLHSDTERWQQPLALPVKGELEVMS